MSIKPTVIGSAAPCASPTQGEVVGAGGAGAGAGAGAAEDPGKLGPTVIGGGQVGVLPAPAAPVAVPQVQPRFQPTRLGHGAAQQPVTPAGSASQTAIRPALAPTPLDSAFLAPRPATKPIKASALPGVQHVVEEVTLEALSKHFPQVELKVLERVQAVLSGLHAPSMDAASWLNFGVHDQEAVAALVRQRLQLAQDPVVRTVTQHLRRMHDLLTGVLEAMQGGFMRKPAAKVWAECQGEVQQLDATLSTADESLRQHMHALTALVAPARECAARLECSTYAAQYLLDHIDAEVGSLLLSRVTSLTGSQAMVKDHLIYLEQDLTQTQELTTLVLDGVLLKLPAVYIQLADLANKPSETQRFMTTEKLAEILHSLKRDPT